MLSRNAQVFFAGGALDPVSFRGLVGSVGFTALWPVGAAECSGVLWRGRRRPHNNGTSRLPRQRDFEFPRALRNNTAFEKIKQFNICYLASTPNLHLQQTCLEASQSWAGTHFLLAPELVELGTTTVSTVVYDVLELLDVLADGSLLVVLVVLVDDGVFLYEVVAEVLLGGER
ncbi:hypothetical protein B0T13DRAFT_125662 [Neurospora crassa]|nr:hypothetical protein B0T13DRAFT_125662 [Neurospora crassa]